MSKPTFPALVFVHGTTFYSKLIRFAQKRRFGPDFSVWNHVAILVGPGADGQGEVVEALSPRLVRRSMKTWDPKTIYKVVEIPDLTEADAAEMLSFLDHEVGERYGWATILSIGLHLLTGGKLTIGLDGTEICSGLAARMLERGNAWYPDPTVVMPAELAEAFCGNGSK